mmetsp:Transcript_76375/g.210904  ORF Transcript_76375/g.210904 Transcript_76375/m.210904 type:complete len:415 (-) Transcript_76375:268-1512(-)
MRLSLGGLSRTHVWHAPVQDAHEAVGEDQHESLEPIGPAVRDDGKDDQHGEENHGKPRRVQVQVQRLAHGPARENGEGHDEQRDLRARPHGYCYGGGHLVVVGHPHSRGVLASVAHDGQQDDPNEGLRDPPFLDEALDGLDHVLGEVGHSASRDEEKAHRPGYCKDGLVVAGQGLGSGAAAVGAAAVGAILASVFAVFPLLEDIYVGVELKKQVSAVADPDEDGAHAGDQEDLAFRCSEGKDCRQAEGQDPHKQHGDVDQGRGTREPLFGSLDATSKEGHPQDQQQVGEDGPQEAVLHRVIQVSADGTEGDDHLHRIAEGGIKQPSDGLVQVLCEMLRRVTEELGQWHQSHEAGAEDGPVGPLVKSAQDAQWSSEEEDVYWFQQEDFQYQEIPGHRRLFGHRLWDLFLLLLHHL